jgi:hypothetical protein
VQKYVKDIRLVAEDVRRWCCCGPLSTLMFDHMCLAGHACGRADSGGNSGDGCTAVSAHVHAQPRRLHCVRGTILLVFLVQTRSFSTHRLHVRNVMQLLGLYQYVVVCTWQGVVLDSVNLPVSVRHTVVGDQLLRGVSGGERKRVTIAEALMGRPQLLLLDDITVCLILEPLFSLSHLRVHPRFAHDALSTRQHHSEYVIVVNQYMHACCVFVHQYARYA